MSGGGINAGEWKGEGSLWRTVREGNFGKVI